MNNYRFGTGSYPLRVALGGDAPLNSAISAVLADQKAAGFSCWEPCIESVETLARLFDLLGHFGLRMPSAYVNLRLHDEGAPSRVPQFLRLCETLAAGGVEILVSNPEPIRWGGSENKDDAALIRQSKLLETLGEALRNRGLALAYHFHDSEFRCGAREVSHVLQHTSLENVKICFDTHWAYRGCGDSQEAAFDLMDRCAPRIASFHLRQSVNGIWSRHFGPGDIDYLRWARWIQERRWSGLIIMEQCWEAGTPEGESIDRAQAASLLYLRGLLEAKA
ncbi:inosose dehydratase [mine drainage metagenome]|uniref:Inosose dehydratase n=1 Tax=mine drainage metagenome TaxID=410659 RepID=A0A1J5RD84_9ZZZZ